MSYLDTVKDQRTRRTMEKVKITKEDLIDVIEHARYAANSRNAQEVRYAIVRKEQLVHDIFDVTNLPKQGLTFEQGPSAFIVVGKDTEAQVSDKALGVDIGIAYQIIRGALYEKGLSDVIIFSANINKVREMINNDKFEPVAVIAIGKSDETVVVQDGGTGMSKDKDNHHVINKLTTEDLIIFND